MRLDHLLSKDWFGGGGFLAVDLVWAAAWVWAGRGCSCGGQLIVSCGFVARGGWLVAVVGIGNTPAAGGLLRPCGRGGPVGGGCPCVLGVCGGGMLSGFWGSAPWLPDLCFCCLFVGGWGWVWVGWL